MLPLTGEEMHHTIIKNSVMYLEKRAMIAMVRNLASKSFMVMMITMIMVMIAMMRNLTSEIFMKMQQTS